jgi:hypothetical protein
MGRKLGSKNKKTKIITKTKNTNTNINNVHVHVEKTKTRKRRTTKPKETNTINPLSKTLGESRLASSNLGFHPRGLINNEPQQPTIIQTIQAPPDPRLDKLDKRTKKIKEYLKSKGDTKDNAINVNSSILATPIQSTNVDIFSDTIEPQKLKFENVTPAKKSFFSKIFSSSKKKKQMEEKPSIPLLEYKPEPENMFSTRSATAPLFAQSSIEIQTSPATPTPTGHKINQELKNLVNQLHAAHPKSKLHIGTFRSAITKKLRELGVDAAHSTTYINKMRAFYDEIYAASNGIEAAGGVM